jgi:tetratricopeptide (TPR) repeat protein
LARWASSLARRPGRLLAVLALLLLAAVGLVSAGVYAWGDYHFRAARSALDRYQYGEASEHLRAALEVRPRDRATLLLAARVARRTGGHDLAADLLDRYHALHGRDDDLVLERALLTAERGGVDEVALFARVQVEKRHPASALILEAMSAGYTRTYRLTEAEACLNTWLERQPDCAQAHHLLGVVHELRGRQQEAAAGYRRAVQIEPEHDEARERLCGMLLDLGLAREALPHVEYLARRQPENRAAAVYLARCRDQLGQQAEAVACLDGALARWPDFAPALAERGKIALRDGDPDAAEDCLGRAAALSPGDYEIHYRLSLALHQLGKTDRAREVEARLKQIEKDLQDNQDLLGKHMQRNPHDPALHYQAGMIALRAGYPDDALRWFNSALKEDPNHGPTHEALAGFYHRAGDLGRAARHRELARQAKAGAAEPAPKTKEESPPLPEPRP